MKVERLKMNDFVSRRRRWATVVLAGVAYLSGSAPLAADPFINLTFDEPDLSGPLTPIYPGGPVRGDPNQLLRGWTATAEFESVTSVAYSPYNLGSGGLAFNLREHDPGNQNTTFGKNYLDFYSTFRRGDLRLEQTGTIPVDAAELWISSRGRIEAFINGVKIGDFDPASGAPQVLNVSPFAGQTVRLEFVVRRDRTTDFDIFGFTSVPEPSTWGLVAVGGAGLGWLGLRGRKRG